MVVVIIACTFRLSTDIMDDIDTLILSFMMQFIVKVLVEYESRRLTCRIRFVHNSSLQENAWLLEMLHKSSSVRFRGLLRMHGDMRYGF